MLVATCKLPSNTAIEPALLRQASFVDSYRIPLSSAEFSVIDIFFAVFGHHPTWLKAILLVRHRLGSWFGLDAASSQEILSPKRKAMYRVGETIGSWPIYFLGESELVAGRDNKHLDFRLSVLKQTEGQGAVAVISTVCRTHNAFGRMYLKAVAPFHRRGITRLLSAAREAGRL